MAPHTSKRRKLNTSEVDRIDGALGHDFPSEFPQDCSQKTPIQYTKNASTGPNSGDQKAHAAGGSSIFRLQLQELLVKLRVPNSHGYWMNKAEGALRKLKRAIELIPDREPATMLKAKRDLQKSHEIQVPFPEPGPGVEAKYMLAYSKPQNINIVGSYARKTAVRIHERAVIDLAVTMPPSIFHEKDHLNHRYFYKRAYYLACLAAGIRENQSCNYNLSFGYQNGNQLQPIILIDPISDGGEDDFSKSKCQIRIILAAAGNLFPITKTLPQKNCIRSKVNDGTTPETVPKATPLYNATIRSECSSLSYLELLQDLSTCSNSFGEACCLGSIWLQQRGFATNLADGGFGQFEWACVMALLLRWGGLKGQPILFNGYSSYQLFKATLQYLATNDLVLKPFIIDSDHTVVGNNNYPLFFDGKRGLNVLFKMTVWSYNTLRHEANLTIKILNEACGDKFTPTFITRVDDPLYRFDYLFSVPVLPSWKKSSSVLDSTDRAKQFCLKLYDVLTKGLGDRAKLIYPQYAESSAWPVTSSNSNGRLSVLVGLLLNPELSGRTVDRGPSVEDKVAAAAFRQFWGEKAELRRFKDGGIEESLVWSIREGQSILDQIIRYVLQRHLAQDAANAVAFLGIDFDSLLLDSTYSNPLAVFQPMTIAFQILEKEIRSLEGLPLQIRQVSAASPQLRYTSCKAPNLGTLGSRTQPVDVCVQFEGSNRWPNDLIAIQRTKFAFLFKIGELLEESKSGLVARLGLENEQKELVNQAFLEIVYPTGASFHLRIHHERELGILEPALRKKSNDLGEKREVAFALSKYKRDFVQVPLHTQAVRTLSTRFYFLSPSIRIMKKWRDSHMLSPHISDELIELLTIRTFVKAYPWQAPGSVMNGYLRTLAFISKWDWQSEPLIVDLSHEMSAKEFEGINLRFEAWRKIDPGMNRIAIFAASNLDPDGTSWTEQGPSKVVAARFTSLAKAACKLVKEQKLEIQPCALFTTSTADYDFIIHLNPKIVDGSAFGQEQQRQVFKNLLHQSSPLSRLNPVQLYLEEITRLYGNNILFFHCIDEGSCIAGLWNPQTTGLRDWKVNVTYSTIPILKLGDAEAKIAINKVAILHDVARLGGDMVSKIEVKW